MPSVFGGGRTPDEFPGERVDEGLLLLTLSGSLPSVDGEIYYTVGSPSGSGFFVKENGTVHGLGGGGLSVNDHEFLNTLAHDQELSSYDEVIYGAFNNISQLNVWTDSSKTSLLQAYQCQYDVSRRLSALTSSQYSGVTLNARVIETPSYDVNHRIVGITRTRVL